MIETSPLDNSRVSSAEQAWLTKLKSSLADLDDTQASLKMMIYGNSGVGKTVAAMQIAQFLTPDDKRILYVDSAEGWVSLRNHPVLKRRTMRMTISTTSMLEDIANAVKQNLAPFNDIGAVVIDEHSSFADYDLSAVTIARASKDDKEKNPDQPTQPDMGVTTNRIKKFTAPLVILKDVNLILVAHERTDKDNIGVVVTSPLYMPKLNSSLRNLMHVVGYMTADEIPDATGKEPAYRREIQVMPTRKIVAKTRVGGFKTIRVSVPAFIRACKEWLAGDRPTEEKDTIQKDETVPVNVETIADETESLSELLDQL